MSWWWIPWQPITTPFYVLSWTLRIAPDVANACYYHALKSGIATAWRPYLMTSHVSKVWRNQWTPVKLLKTSTWKYINTVPADGLTLLDVRTFAVTVMAKLRCRVLTIIALFYFKCFRYFISRGSLVGHFISSEDYVVSADWGGGGEVLPGGLLGG